MRAVLQGVSVVIHTASLVDIGQVSSKQLAAVNIQGTENVIRACVECNVPRLVYTSTQDVVTGWKLIRDMDEGTPYAGNSASDFVYGAYAFTKMQGEKRVLAANGTKLANGNTFVTCALRLNLLYGEGDPWLLPSVINMAKSNLGYLTRMGDGASPFQLCYVGNAAWAHLIAIRCTASKPGVIGGKAYHITDETPVQDFFTSLEPFLVAAGCRLTTFSIPYTVVWLVALFLEFIAWVLKPFVAIKVPITRGNVFGVCKGATFSGEKAKKELGYLPLYSFQESKTQTIRYVVEKHAT